MGVEGVGPRNEFHPSRRRVEKRSTRRAGLAHTRILACTYTRGDRIPSCAAVRDGRGCWENDNAALERRFVNTLEKMRGVLGEGARKGGTLRNGGVVRSRRKTFGNPPPRPLGYLSSTDRAGVASLESQRTSFSSFVLSLSLSFPSSHGSRIASNVIFFVIDFSLSGFSRGILCASSLSSFY